MGVLFFRATNVRMIFTYSSINRQVWIFYKLFSHEFLLNLRSSRDSSVTFCNQHFARVYELLLQLTAPSYGRRERRGAVHHFNSFLFSLLRSRWALPLGRASTMVAAANQDCTDCKRQATQWNIKNKMRGSQNRRDHSL